MNDPALRAKIEAAIDRLVAVLDAMDAADEDREPQGDEEPSLGWTNDGQWGCRDGHDFEWDRSDWEPDDFH